MISNEAGDGAQRSNLSVHMDRPSGMAAAADRPIDLGNEEHMQSTVGYKSPLYEMTRTTPTCLWNDSASISELTYSIEHGAVGATCNPVIVVGTLKKELAEWKDRIAFLLAKWPAATEDEIAWHLVREMSVKAAALLKPIFDAHAGRNGRVSIQTDPRLFRDARSIVAQAGEFNELAPNVIVKIPATRAGISAMEEATYRGISVNATVCFTLPQCLAVAEAIERGLRRREMERKEIATMGPVCTIMVGRVDDWLKVVAERENITTNPGSLDWAGGLQEGLPDFPRVRISTSASVGGLSQPLALERIHRGRCRDLSALLMAASIQLQRRRRDSPDERPSRSEDCA